MNPSLKTKQSTTSDFEYVAMPATDEALQKSDGSPQFPRTLYPPIEPYESGLLDVGDGHQVYWECSGNPSGPAAVLLHGGPGGGCSPRSRRFFDPSHFRIVCLDQRGCGRSHPNAADDWKKSLLNNNTGKLVADLELIRKHCKVEKWEVVVGGSWGSTLALAYAEAHSGSMKSLVLRGIFLFSPGEVDHLFQSGATAQQNPEVRQAGRRRDGCTGRRQTRDEKIAEKKCSHVSVVLFSFSLPFLPPPSSLFSLLTLLCNTLLKTTSGLGDVHQVH